MGISALTTIFLIYVGLKFGGLGGMLLALILGMFVIILNIAHGIMTVPVPRIGNISTIPTKTA